MDTTQIFRLVAAYSAMVGRCPSEEEGAEKDARDFAIMCLVYSTLRNPDKEVQVQNVCEHADYVYSVQTTTLDAVSADARSSLARLFDKTEDEFFSDTDDMETDCGPDYFVIHPLTSEGKRMIKNALMKWERTVPLTEPGAA